MHVRSAEIVLEMWILQVVIFKGCAMLQGMGRVEFMTSSGLQHLEFSSSIFQTQRIVIVDTSLTPSQSLVVTRVLPPGRTLGMDPELISQSTPGYRIFRVQKQMQCMRARV